MTASPTPLYCRGARGAYQQSPVLPSSISRVPVRAVHSKGQSQHGCTTVVARPRGEGILPLFFRVEGASALESRARCPRHARARRPRHAPAQWHLTRADRKNGHAPSQHAMIPRVWAFFRRLKAGLQTRRPDRILPEKTAKTAMHSLSTPLMLLAQSEECRGLGGRAPKWT